MQSEQELLWLGGKEGGDGRRAGGDGGSGAVTSGRRAGRDPADAPFRDRGEIGRRAERIGRLCSSSSGRFPVFSFFVTHSSPPRANFPNELHFLKKYLKARRAYFGSNAYRSGTKERARLAPERESATRGGGREGRIAAAEQIRRRHCSLPPSLLLSHSLRTKLDFPPNFPSSFLPCSVPSIRQSARL